MASNKGAVRFYEKALPSANDVVWVKVMQVNDTSATVHLLEYANHEGMIPYTEFTRLRIRAVGKVIKVGRLEAAQVLRVDTDKGYIDLSKKLVTRMEGKYCEERYVKARDVHCIICHAADDCGIPRALAVEKVSWPLYRQTDDQIEGAAPSGEDESAADRFRSSYACPAYEAFRKVLQDPTYLHRFFANTDVPTNLLDKMVTIIQHRLKTQPVKLRADIEVTCFTSKGITAIKEILRVGQQFGQGGSIALNVSVVAPPLYSIRTQTDHKEEGIQLLKDAIDAMRQACAQYGGKLEVAMHPRVVGEDGEVTKQESEAESEEDDDGEAKA